MWQWFYTGLVLLADVGVVVYGYHAVVLDNWKWPIG